jgi:membrane-bound serine protease (ClpP class)
MITPAELETGSRILFMVALLAVTAIFYLVEVCTPTFGVMAVAGVICEVAALVFAFTVSVKFGFLMVFVCLIGTPVYLYFMVKLLPKTPLGKALILSRSRDATSEATPEAGELSSLVGRTGTVLSDLRPVGKVRIDGRTYDARAERVLIDSGTEIEVIAAGGTDLVVRSVESPQE